MPGSAMLGHSYMQVSGAAGHALNSGIGVPDGKSRNAARTIGTIGFFPDPVAAGLHPIRVLLSVHADAIRNIDTL